MCTESLRKSFHKCKTSNITIERQQIIRSAFKTPVSLWIIFHLSKSVDIMLQKLIFILSLRCSKVGNQAFKKKLPLKKCSFLNIHLGIIFFYCDQFIELSVINYIFLNETLKSIFLYLAFHQIYYHLLSLFHHHQQVVDQIVQPLIKGYL